jgi:hypothetical protein
VSRSDADYGATQANSSGITKQLLADVKEQFAGIRTAISQESPTDSPSIEELAKNVKDLGGDLEKIANQLLQLRGRSAERIRDKKWYKRSIGSTIGINKAIKELEIFETEVKEKLANKSGELRKLQDEKANLENIRRGLEEVFLRFNNRVDFPISSVVSRYSELKKQSGDSLAFKNLCIFNLGDKGYNKFLAQLSIIKRVTDNTTKALTIDEAMAFADLNQTQQIACLSNGVNLDASNGKKRDHQAAVNLLSGLLKALKTGTPEQKEKTRSTFLSLAHILNGADIDYKSSGSPFQEFGPNPVKIKYDSINEEMTSM